jgi:hypothetical protein
MAAVILLAAAVHAAPLEVKIEAAQGRVGMGLPVTVRAQATLGGKPAAGALLLPYVNGKRWGSHEVADAQGRATFIMPMPNPGPQEVLVEGRAAPLKPSERWIWAPTTSDAQPVWLQCAFALKKAESGASLWVAVDDGGDVFVNGKRLYQGGGWTDCRPLAVPQGLLRAGQNVLSAACRNGAGPAGFAALLLAADGRTVLARSGPGWRSFASEPAGWPGAASGGDPARMLDRIDQGLWAAGITRWPTVLNKSGLIAGTLLPKRASVSNTLQVQVDRRALRPIPSDPKHLVGMQWEPWFTPKNANWTTAQVAPLMGFYWSWNADVTRQHMLWFAESGIDFLVVDWTNHIWDKKHWSERPEGTNEIIHSTQLGLESAAMLRDEGIQPPKFVLLVGLNNGPYTTVEAVNEEMAWAYDAYVRNPRFKDLFVMVEGKPLILVFNGGGPGWLEGRAEHPIDESQWTVRWCSSQHQGSKDNEKGFWSWMDGTLKQPVTRRDGKAEALTVSAGFFAGGGWLAKDAYGHRNGWTYVESFRGALKHRPSFIQLHQFQEYAGQPEGQGYGPNHDIYVDSYSAELSDDIEPVSLTTPAYRGNGGWGYLMQNLTKALVDLYRQPEPVTTVVAIGAPLRGDTVRGDSLDVMWTSLGKEPASYTVLLNGKPVAKGLKATRAQLDLRGVPAGPVTLRVRAEGAVMRYLPAYTDDSLRLPRPVPAWAELTFQRARP